MMLLATFQRLCNKIGGKYDYIGFGGLSFTDFKLFFKNLNINKMITIEGGSQITEKRINFNKPYSNIDIRIGKSTEVLSKIAFAEKTIIWLDYDGQISPETFEDITFFFSSAPAGSIFILSCNSRFKENGQDIDTVDKFKSYFGNRVPENVSLEMIQPGQSRETIWKMLNKCVKKNIDDRNRIESKQYEFRQLFHFSYKDGAQMYTYGGVILDESIRIGNISDIISDLDFIYTEGKKPYSIKVDPLTFKEYMLVNSCFGLSDSEIKKEVDGILNPQTVCNFHKYIKYLPNFASVEL